MVNIYFDFKGKIISQSLLTEVILGCNQTIERIEKLGDAIEEFEITFVEDTKRQRPVFKILFRDPLGKEGSHTIDFRSIGAGSDLTALEIADVMSASLSPLIIEHLKRCLQKVETVRNGLREMIPFKDLVADLLKFYKQFVCVDRISECHPEECESNLFGNCSGR